MGKHKQIFRRFLVVAGLFMLVLGVLGMSGALAQNVTTGYQSDEALQKGMIVRLKRGDAAKVAALTQNEVPEMLGVVVSSSDSPVSLSNPTAEKQVFVATFGQYDVLVSTQNGPIKEGDFITISSLKGVGMRAESTQELIIGKALKGFDGKSATEAKVTLETSNGKKEVRLGRVPVEVAVAHNPLYSENKEEGVPKILSNAVDIVTDRPVTAFRIYASLAVLFLSLIIAGMIIFSGVRNGMVSIGRNPLAKTSIVKGLIQVTLMSLIVFAIGLFAVYLLLRI